MLDRRPGLLYISASARVRRGVRFGIAAFVYECGARIEIRADVEKRLKVAAITGLTAGRGLGVLASYSESVLQVNLGREKPPRERPARPVSMLPPIAPACERYGGARTNGGNLTPAPNALRSESGTLNAHSRYAPTLSQNS